MFGKVITFCMVSFWPFILCDGNNAIYQGRRIAQASVFPEVHTLKQEASAYTLAQTIAWLNSTYLVVGAWSGILSLYHYQAEVGRLQLKQIIKSDLGDGIQMVFSLFSRNLFVSSNTNGSLLLHNYDPINNTLSSKPLFYDSSIGFANSAVYSEHILVTGHQTGFIIIWNDTEGSFQQIGAVNISSPNPISSPHALKNIRALSVWREGLIASGSEDGDICLIEIPSGNVILRKRYSLSAQRGINDLQVYQDYLFLSNCAVGQTDKNTWLYRLTGSHENVSIDLVHAVNLQKNLSLPQVYNFNVALGPSNSSTSWFASTQEGLLWFGVISENKLVVQGSISFGIQQGFALDYYSNALAAASNNIFVYHISDQFLSTSSGCDDVHFSQQIYLALLLCTLRLLVSTT